ncbi:MAG: serine/threonine-protein kinase, partial [Polyangiaceae bacterium]
MHLRVLADCLAGLHAAHELTDFEGNALNVVHRDVSPHNVMVTYDGQVKVLDFGIAKAADSSSDTRTGIMKGKCAYMAAEQFGGTKVDRRADVFAVGVMLWQALTGARMWKGLSDADIFQRLATGDIRKPTSVKPEIPAALEEICMRALALKPEDRFPTAAEFQNELEKYLGTLQQAGTARDVGKFVSTLFEDSRAALKTAIEQQMRANASATEAAKKNTTEVPLLWQLVPNSTGDVAAVASSGEFDSPRSVSGPVSSMMPGPPEVRRKGRLAMLAGIGVVALGVLVVAATGYRKPVVIEVAPPVVTTPVQVAAPQVVVSVKATPSQAKIYLDDVPLPTNPATSTFVKDGTSHRLRVEAPGFQKKVDFITYDSNTVSIDITLEPDVVAAKPAAVWPPVKGGRNGANAAAQAAAAAQHEQQAATTPATPQVTNTGEPAQLPSKPPKQPGTVIDQGDPWGQKKVEKP